MNLINDLPIYLTFDDLSLLPRHNHGTPENISLKTQVTKNFQLNLLEFVITVKNLLKCTTL